MDRKSKIYRIEFLAHLNTSATSIPYCARLRYFACHGLLIFRKSVTENGFSVKDESSKIREDVLHDTDRVNYFKGITRALKAAVLEDGVDVRSYLAWSECGSVYLYN